MLTLALLGLAHARPDAGTGLYAFDETDVVVSIDSPAASVRVWYSVDGPNVVKADDDDADGVPDFATEVALTAEHVLQVYADAGFRAPLSDGARGGSAAMDVYLVDFAGNADGMYAAESCSSRPTQCSGYFVMENDFAGYGYADLASAIRVLTSHELFHAVQAAYDAEEEVWFSEGTAVWAENLYDPGNADFLHFCSAYLDDPGRSLDEPPSGPVPTFAYATGLWWWFLANRYGDDVMVSLLEATESGDTLLADMALLQEERGGTLTDDFATFARWNLATGAYAGAAESYPFAADLGAPRAEDNGAPIVDDNRFYPLATTYYKLEHPGGEVWFAAEADAPELAFSLHATTPDGDVLDALTTFAGSVTPMSLGELDAGDYWLVGANPTLAEESTKVLVCLGSAADVAACAPAADTGGDTGGDDPDAPEGCGCTSGSGTLSGALLVAAVLLAGRRRRV